MGAERTSSDNPFPTVAAPKASTVTEVLLGFLYIRVDLRHLQELIIWSLISCCISTKTNRQKRTKIPGWTTVKKLTNHSGSFEDAAIFKWQPMKALANMRCSSVSVTVCDNHRMYNLVWIPQPFAMLLMHYTLSHSNNPHWPATNVRQKEALITP